MRQELSEIFGYRTDVRGKHNLERAEVSVGAKVRLKTRCTPVVDEQVGVLVLVENIEDVSLDDGGRLPPGSAQQRWCRAHVMATKQLLVLLLEHRLHRRAPGTPCDSRDNPRNGGDPGAEMRLDPLGAFGGGAGASRAFRDL